MNFGDWRIKSFIREEVEGATEDDACIVPRLQRGDKHRLAAHSVRVLFYLI